MTTSAKPAAFLPLAKLPRTPASDLKKLGWRGMMNDECAAEQGEACGDESR